VFYLRDRYAIYCYSISVIVMLLNVFLVCWFLSFVLCVAILVVSCSGSVFKKGGGVCVLLTGVHFLQCSEYWVMCINVCVIHV
jgi:hypothetical protein